MVLEKAVIQKPHFLAIKIPAVIGILNNKQ